jgi:hypothetical protein
MARVLAPSVKAGLGVAVDQAGAMARESLALLDPVAKPVGQVLDRAGNILVAAPSDVGAYLGNPKAGFRGENLMAAAEDRPLPAEQTFKESPAAMRIPAEAAAGIARSVPRLGAAAANPALAPIAFGATSQGFDVKQAVLAEALPYIGTKGGKFTEFLAQKLGISSDRALMMINKAGGATAAAGLVTADQARQISKLPEGQKRNAWFGLVGNVLGILPLSVMGEREKPSTEKEPAAAPADKPAAAEEPLTAEKVLSKPPGSHSAADIASMSQTEFRKLIEAKDESGKTKYTLTGDATLWAMKQTRDVLPELVKLRDAAVKDTLASLKRGEETHLDKSQWFADAIHAIERDDVGKQNVEKFSSPEMQKAMGITAAPASAPAVEAKPAEGEPVAAGEAKQWRVNVNTATQKNVVKTVTANTLSEAESAAAKIEGVTFVQKGTARPLEVEQPTSPAAAPAQPAMVGMGAAASGEVPAAGDASVTGLAERVRGQREASGQTAPTQPGQGISPEASVERGRALLPNSDPERIMAGFDQTGRFSADDVAVARARTEQLAQATNRAEERFGTDSPEFRAAFKAESDWSARTKKMQTEWAKSGAAQQGEVDVDTGTFSGLARAFKSDTGKDFTPAQAGTAKKISKNVKVAAGAAEVARKNLYDQLDLELGKVDVPVPKDLDEARMQFAKYQSGTGFTPQQVKTLWNVARKFYLDRGVTDFDDIRNGLATDFGMKVQDVTRALGQSKGTRRLTDDMWKKQQSARRLDQQAKRWLTQTALPKYRRAMESVPRILFGLKVGFHGTVALGTHAPAVAFQPRFWNTYVRDFGKMYHMVASPAYYEMQVQDLMRRQNYTTARRAGLVNDPFQYEDYNSPKVAEYFGPITGMGNRGYAVLKILRQDMFDQHWNNLPDSARTPEVAKAIADGLNHATGVVKGNAPKGANIALFAPRLEASRVAWLTVDPVKAANTFARWKTATPAEKYFAINQVKEKAWVLGTMTSILALNQGFLMATGSKQKINFANPMKSDWMKFKAAGMDLSYGNAMLSMARLPVRLYQIRESTGGKLRNLIYPDEDTYSVLGQYGRSQLSPFASLATELWLKGDWENRPLPDSTRPVPKRLRAQGVKPYTWPEFWAEQLSPIPAEEAMRDVWKNGLGMTPEQIASASKAMATLAVMSGTGARLTDDVQPTK